MSLLLLDRLSEILACCELMDPSASSMLRGSEVTDVCDKLLWDEWLPLSKRLLKRILKRQKGNTFIEEILGVMLPSDVCYTFILLQICFQGVLCSMELLDTRSHIRSHFLRTEDK